MKFDSIKFEISFLYALILGLILIIFSSVLYVILSSTLYRELDYDLQFKAQEISNSIRAYADIQAENPEALVPAAQVIIAEGHKYLKWRWAMGSDRRWLEQVKKIDVNEGYINFVDTEGKSVANSKNINEDLMAILSKDLKDFIKDKPVFRNIMYNKQKIRLIYFPFVYKDTNKYVVQVGISPQPTAQLLQGWLYSMILSIPLIVFLTSFVGWLLATRFLSPVNKIIATAEKISSEDLKSRVQEEHYAVEMQSLVEAFNGMIARLEKSFRHIEEFSSHVAHELKTPLTIIRGETELALRDDCEAQEYRRVLKVTVAETEKMLKTIEDLLYLAKLDYQPKVFKFTVFDFVEFFNEIYEQSKILAASKKLKVSVNLPSSPIMINADPLHLRRLFFNLIDNALKFTPAGGRIDLAVKQDDDQIVVSIADTGRGISEQNLMKIFDKFFREDTLEYGNGLGLSITQAIAKIHHGSVDVYSKLNQGTIFTVTLPLSRLPVPALS